MSSDCHPGSPGTTYKPTSSITRLPGWMKARFLDVMVVAEVLHDVRWAAPWDDARSPHSSSESLSARTSGELSTRRDQTNLL